MHRRARSRRQPPLRHSPQYLNLHRPDRLSGHCSGSGDSLGVAGQLRALDQAAPLHHNPVMGESFPGARQLLGGDHQLVQLGDCMLGKDHPEPAGGCLDRAVYKSERRWRGTIASNHATCRLRGDGLGSQVTRGSRRPRVVLVHASSRVCVIRDGLVQTVAAVTCVGGAAAARLTCRTAPRTARRARPGWPSR